jgi:hypothetical protein
MPRRTRFVPLLLAALVFAALALGVSACGWSSDSKEVVEGEVVELGDLKYQVIFSRFLNPNDNEDSAYLTGQPAPKDGSTYFGVFLEVQNKSEETQQLPPAPFTIEDADGETYTSLPSESLYAFPFDGKVESQEPIPAPDSTPQQGPIEGSVVIFELPPSASENRPLTMEIPAPDPSEEAAEIKLDL